MRYWLRHYVESLYQCPRCGHVTWVVLWRDIWNHTWHMFWRWHFAPAPSRGDPRIDRFPEIVANIGSQVHAALLRHPWRCYIRFCTQDAPKWTQKKKKGIHGLYRIGRPDQKYYPSYRDRYVTCALPVAGGHVVLCCFIRVSEKQDHT